VTMPDLVLSLRVGSNGLIPIPAEEPSHFIYEIAGDVVASTMFEENRLAGRFRIYYANFEDALNRDVSPRDVLDTYAHTFEFADAVLDEDGMPFSHPMERLLGYDIFSTNLLILDRLEILPQFRGFGVGLVVLVKLMARYGPGAGVVAMKPFPLQFEAKHEAPSAWDRRLQLGSLAASQAVSTRKLRKYYKRLGFIPIPKPSS
jgi:hypothetical protein